jgi:hypothetical protein
MVVILTVVRLATGRLVMIVIRVVMMGMMSMKL